MRSFCGGGQWQRLLHLCYCDHGLTKLEKNKVWRGAGRRRAQSEGNTSIKVVSDLDHDVRRREQRVEVQIFSRAAKVILRCDMYIRVTYGSNQNGDGVVRTLQEFNKVLIILSSNRNIISTLHLYCLTITFFLPYFKSLQ